jgi:hypothetical protein
MAFDLTSELRRPLRSADGRAVLADAIGPTVDAIGRQRLVEQASGEGEGQ